MKNLTRLLCMLLAIITIFGLLPLTAMANNMQTTHSVKFKLNYNGAHEIPAQKVTDGEYAIQPENVTRKGYIFAYWFIKTDDGAQKFDLSQPITENITLYAHWDEDTEYWSSIWNKNILNAIEKKDTLDKTQTDSIDNKEAQYVTFMLNDGTDNVYLMQLISYGDTVDCPQEPIRDQYSFINWYTEPETLHEFDFTTPITSNTFLYAGWGDPYGDDSALYASASGGETTYSISSVEINEQNLYVTINANDSVILSVHFWADTEFLYKGNFIDDINAPELLSTVSARTPDYCEIVPIIIPISDDLPEHYYVTVDLYDDQENKLCNTYVSIEKTSLYKIYDSKTTNDFDEKLVVQFAEEINDNFAVLNEDVKHIISTNSTNILSITTIPVISDNGNGDESVLSVDNRIYTFTNPDDNLKEIKSGDIIYVEDTTYLFKVDSIIKNNYEIIITESDDVDLTDFYQYIKVDMDICNKQENNNPNYETNGTILDASPSFQINPSIKWTPKEWLELSGELSLKGQFHLKIEYDIKLFEKDYLLVETTAELEAKFTAGVSVSTDNIDPDDSIKAEYDILKIGVPTPIAGLTIEIKPSIPIELEAKASGNFEATFNMSTGFSYSSYDGIQNVDKKQGSIKLNLQGETSAKVGPKLKIAVAFCKKAFEANINASFGVKFTAQTNEIGVELTNSEDKHGCNLCIEGTAKWYAEIYAAAKYSIIKKVLESDIGKWCIVKFEGDFPISPNFYISLLNSRDSYFEGKIKFGWGNCPNTCYRTNFIVKNADGEEIKDILINVKHDRTGILRTGKSPFNVYLYKGVYTASADINTDKIQKSVNVTSAAQNIILTANSRNGDVYGKIIDSITGEAVKNANIVISQNNINITSTQSDSDGSFRVKLADGIYLIKISKENYQTYQDYVTISNAVTSYLQTTKLVPIENNSKRGGFSGRIVDSLTGEPLNNVRIKLREGWNHPDQGNIIDVLYTNENGEFKYELKKFLGINIGLKPGEYTLTAEKDGYTKTSYCISVVADVEKSGQNFSMSPILEEEQYRIVLSWGVKPLDLDSHLIAPLPNGESFHLYYPYAESNGSHSYSSYFTLDLDDVTSYGPETTTIKQCVDGKYYFYVNNFSGESPMISSSAKVEVYYGNDVRTFNIPLDQGDGKYWNVFVLDTESNTITPINTITDMPQNISVDISSSKLTDSQITDILYDDIMNNPKK